MGRAKHPHDSRRPESAAVKLGIEIFREEGDIEPLRSSLSPRQRAFCEEYVVDFNGTAAVIRAGYSINYADRQAHILLKNAGVAAYIDFLTGSKEAKIVSMNPDYLLQQLSGVMSKEGIRDGDKLRAIELAMRHFGMLTDKTESKVTIDTVERQKIEEEASSFTNALNSLRKRHLADKANEKTIKDIDLV